MSNFFTNVPIGIYLLINYYSLMTGLPPALFTLMKSTEPWSDEYYVYDIESALTRVGFADVVTVASDPRHRSILARKL